MDNSKALYRAGGVAALLAALLAGLRLLRLSKE
jgi:hypothetical protein